VDPEVARALLQSTEYDLDAAVEMVYGGTRSPLAMPPIVPTHDDAIDMDTGSMDVLFDPEPALHEFPSPIPEITLPEHDAQLAAAIAHGYESPHRETITPQEPNEEDMMEQAMRLSAEDAQRREREALREEQEMELRESILMDQMREVQAQSAREAEEISRKERESVRHAQEEELQRKRQRLIPEPPEKEPGRRALLFRLPGGSSLRRAFSAGSTMGALYDYLDVQCADQEWVSRYALVSSMPKRTYENRTATLAELQIASHSALLVECTRNVAEAQVH